MDRASLEWHQELGIGVPDLDNAHEELVDLYNRIAKACERHRDISKVREHIRTFLLYARWHFGEEERRMNEWHYPKYLDHQADHSQLLQDAEDFLENLGQSIKEQDSLVIASYFKYWLTRHAGSKDAELKRFYSSLPPLGEISIRN